MCTRNLVASSRKQQPQQQQQVISGRSGVHRYRNGLLLGCDGIQETFSGGGINRHQINGNGSDEQSIYLKHHQKGNKNHQQQQIQYVDSNGSILTLATSDEQQHFPDPKNNAAHHQLAHMQSTSGLVNGNSNSNFSKLTSAGNHLDQSTPPIIHKSHQTSKQIYEVVPANCSRRQQLHHRHLQHQVHQQLQQIYGNATERNQQPQTISPQYHDQASDRQHLILKRHKHQIDEQQILHQSSMSAGQPSEFIEREQQFRSNMIKQNQQLMMMNNQSVENANQGHKSLQEQQYDSLGPPGILKAHQINEKLFGPETGGGVQRQQGSTNICAIAEECDDEDELLLPKPTNHHLINQDLTRSVTDRKSQLEDLHYATVTAAALLSATANAAAAFAATEKHFELAKEPRKIDSGSCLIGSGGGEHQSVNQMSSIYSDTYHEIRKHRPQVIETQQQHHQHHVAPAPRYKQLQMHHQNMSRAPIYAVAMDPVNFVNNISEQRRQKQPHSITTIAASNAIYSPITRVNQSQSQQIYQMLPANHHQHQQQQQFQQQLINCNNRLQQPPLRQHTQLLAPQVDHSGLRHQRMIQQQAPIPTPHTQQQVPLTQPQALAILHRGGKVPASLGADMIGRLLVNNLMASQRILTRDDAHYGLVGGQSSRALANKLMDSHGLVSRELMYGVAGREKLFGLSNWNNFHNQPTVAPSDSSGHSTVPLVLDRNLKSLSFIDRICRIDLTIFWWSLMIISFLFIGAIFALSRYIH